VKLVLLTKGGRNGTKVAVNTATIAYVEQANTTGALIMFPGGTYVVVQESVNEVADAIRRPEYDEIGRTEV
jgi:uncharacterized protein YlzI (FlbEa/FlbD family)